MKRILLLSMLLSLATGAFAGGHVDIAITPLPKTLVAGRAFPVEFHVRYPDGTPVEKLKPVVIATSGKRRVQIGAVARTVAGDYAARLTLPKDGRWNVTVDVKYCDNTAVLRDVVVAKTGAASAASVAR